MVACWGNAGKGCEVLYSSISEILQRRRCKLVQRFLHLSSEFLLVSLEYNRISTLGSATYCSLGLLWLVEL